MQVMLALIIPGSKHLVCQMLSLMVVNGSQCVSYLPMVSLCLCIAKQLLQKYCIFSNTPGAQSKPGLELNPSQLTYPN